METHSMEVHYILAKKSNHFDFFVIFLLIGRKSLLCNYKIQISCFCENMSMKILHAVMRYPGRTDNPNSFVDAWCVFNIILLK